MNVFSQQPANRVVAFTPTIEARDGDREINERLAYSIEAGKTSKTPISSLIFFTLFDTDFRK